MSSLDAPTLIDPARIDPTRTLTLRKMMEAEIARRFNALRRAIIRLLEEEDAFGLKRQSQVEKQFAQYEALTGNSSTIVGNTRYAFQTTSEQAESFRQWLQQQIDEKLLPPTGATGVATTEDWWKKYTEEAYQRGLGRSFDDVNRMKGLPEVYSGKKQQFLNLQLGGPAGQERVKQLSGRVFEEMKGLSASMVTGMRRELVDGLIQGKNPKVIARNLTKNVGIHKTRAERIARTEIIRAHAEGQLDSLEKMGVASIGVQAEWSATAGACELCAPLNGVVMSIAEARGLIPRHPNCVTAEMRIYSPSVKTFMRTLYTGTIYDFHLEDGRLISTTSRHVLLTQTGWKFAKDVTDLDHFINTCDSFHWHLMEPCIANRFLEASRMWGTTKLENSDHSLHGDGRFCNAPVDLVHCPIFVVGDQALERILKASALAADSVAEVLHMGDILEARSLLASPRRIRASSLNEAINRFNHEIGEKAVGIESVTLRNVIDLPVYDVSTPTTSYSLEGIISSNCKCAYVPHISFDQTLGGGKELQSAIQKSIQAEIPKGLLGKRSIGEQRALSKWVGSDVKDKSQVRSALRSLTESKNYSRAKNVAGKAMKVANAAPEFAKQVAIEAGASPGVAKAAFYAATAVDFAVPGVPAGSILVTAIASVKKPTAAYNVAKNLISKYLPKKAGAKAASAVSKTAKQAVREVSKKGLAPTATVESSTIPVSQRIESKIATRISKTDKAKGDIVEALEGALKSVPSRVKAAVSKNGVEVRIGNTLTDAIPRLKGQTPRGYPPGTTWDFVEGMYTKQEKKIALAEFSESVGSAKLKSMTLERRLGTFRHEYGHAIDDIANAQGIGSKSEGFRAAYIKDVAKITAEDRKLVSYLLQKGNAGPEEAYAEIFANLHGGGTFRNQQRIDALQRSFPSTFKAVENSLQSIKIGSVRASGQASVGRGLQPALKDREILINDHTNNSQTPSSSTDKDAPQSGDAVGKER